MENVALLVRHRSLPGKREEVLRVWEKYVKPRAERNPAHLHYHFCFDNADPDAVIAFQVYTVCQKSLRLSIVFVE